MRLTTDWILTRETVALGTPCASPKRTEGPGILPAGLGGVFEKESVGAGTGVPALGAANTASEGPGRKGGEAEALRQGCKHCGLLRPIWYMALATTLKSPEG